MLLAALAFLTQGWIWSCGSRANRRIGSSRRTGQLTPRFCRLLCNYTIGLPEDWKQKTSLVLSFAGSETAGQETGRRLVGAELPSRNLGPDVLMRP